MSSTIHFTTKDVRRMLARGSVLRVEGITPEELLAEEPKRSKYNNVKTWVDDILLDSAHEANCWILLKARERAGQIQDLQRQVEFRLVENGVLHGIYKADFTYYEDGQFIVADAKGYRTQTYLRKRRQMKRLYGITITEM